MQADDDWVVVLSDGNDGSSDHGDSASDDGSDCGFVRVRKPGSDRRRSVVVRDPTPPTTAVAAAAAVPQPTLQGAARVISYREAFSSAPSPGDGGGGCGRSDLFFDDTTIREALFGAGCCSHGAGIGKEDCECEVGEHGGTGSSSVVKAPSAPSVAAAAAPTYSPLSELPSGMEEEGESSGEEVEDEEEAGTSGEEVEDEMDAGTSGEEEDEDLDHSSEEDDYDEYTESCSEEEDDDTDSFCEKEEEDDYDDTESSGEEWSSHVADCEHQADKLQATGNEEPPAAFPVNNKYDDIDDSESDDESKYGYIDIIPSPRRADADTLGYCKTACIACGGSQLHSHGDIGCSDVAESAEGGTDVQLRAAIEAEKELLDFCPCKYGGIRTGSSGMGEGSLESSDEQRGGSAENDGLLELFSKILETMESDEEDETSSSDTEQSDSDEDDGVDSSDVDESSDEEEPVGISYHDIDCSEEEEEDNDEEEELEEEEEDHRLDVVDAAAVAQRDVAGLDVPPARVQDRPPGQRRPGSPTPDLTLVVVYLLVYLAFSYTVMLFQGLA